MARQLVNRRELIASLDAMLEGPIGRATEIAALADDRLARRPAPGTWSAMEVFEHMNLSSGIYLRRLQRAFDSEAFRAAASPAFLPGRIGEWAVHAMLPREDGRIAWRMRTLKLFDPARRQGADAGSIVRFIALCQGFRALLAKAEGLDLASVRITSSLGPVIRFKAGDAFRFPIAHQERHMRQIERLVAAAPVR